jgi:glycosyltransferase involved in cell wall biosynthesis
MCQNFLKIIRMPSNPGRKRVKFSRIVRDVHACALPACAVQSSARMISFIVPAHNEQAYLPKTLQAIHEAARAVGQPYEIVVANDASTDATESVARENGARVVSVNNRQIAATRNSGARATLGERLFFVDADTMINAKAVAEALRLMNNGAVGGGGPVWLGKGEAVPLYIRVLSVFQVILAKAGGFTGGAFLFCRTDAFRATGGFNERMFWGEEGDFILKLKREGRFIVLWKPVLTSGRRFRTAHGGQVLTLCSRVFFAPRKLFTDRASVEKIWYDSNRERDDVMPRSAMARFYNSIALVVILVMLTGPLWDFVPWSMTPLGTPLGIVRLVIGTFLCHVGLLFWPIAIILLVNVLRQKRLTGVVHSAVLIGICVWQGWGCTRGVIWVWERAGHWVLGVGL